MMFSIRDRCKTIIIKPLELHHRFIVERAKNHPVIEKVIRVLATLCFFAPNLYFVISAWDWKYRIASGLLLIGSGAFLLTNSSQLVEEIYKSIYIDDDMTEDITPLNMV